MPYNVPTLRQLIASGLIDIESSLDEILPKFGIEQALNVAVSGSIRDLYDYQTWIVRQIIPTTESDNQTIIDTARFEGVIQKMATQAKGPVTLSGNVPVPLNTMLTHQDGRLYRVIETQSPNSGAVSVLVEAEEAGAAGNLIAGDVLTLVSPVSGIQSNGVTGDISGGADLEPASQVLERLLFRKRNPPMGGAPYDYVAWCREVPGVTRAWAVDYYQGRSTVGYAFVFDDREDIIPNHTDIQIMNQYIYRHQDPATGADVGRPGGIEAVNIPITLKRTNLGIALVPDSDELRLAVAKSLEGYIRTLSPGDTLLLSAIRTAIGSINGVTDYSLDLSADVIATDSELHAIGEITWGTQ